MAKFKRFDEGNSKRGKDRRREDYDSFESHDRRKYRHTKNEVELTKRRSNNKNYMYYDESEDI